MTSCLRGCIWIAALTAGACSRGAAPAQADLRPIANQNVLLVTIDTLRADALGAYGGRAATPALDRLAAEGVRFDFAHAHAVVTLPSHASILTGRYPYDHGVRDNSGYRLAADAPTLATRLKQAGYATAAFVAAFPLHSRFGLSRGFDVYDDRFGETHAPSEFVMPERPASVVVPLARAWIAAPTSNHQSPGTPSAAPSTNHQSPGTPSAAPTTNHQSPGTTPSAAPTTSHQSPGTPSAAPAPSTQHPPPSTRPWFMWVHVFDPHAPYKPPPPFDAQYAARPYDGEVAATDAALAPLLDDVRRSARPTLVIVTADHGESLGEHGEEAHGLFAYEATLRVPLIVAELGGSTKTVRLKPDTTYDGVSSSSYVPSASGRTSSSLAGAVTSPPRGVTPLSYVASGFSRTSSWASTTTATVSAAGGEVASVLARHVDILPTVLEAVGQPVPDGLPGRSLLAAAARRADPSRSSYFEAMSGVLNRGAAPLTGVLVDRDKFIDLPIPERYELAADPAERVNLAGRSPDRDRTLAAALAGYHAAPPGARAAETAAAAAQLRALGYVSGGAARKARYTEEDDPKRLIEIEAEVHRAVEAYGAGRVADAAAIYQRVIARRPDFALASRHLAFLEARRGNLRAAIDVLKRLVGRGAAAPEIVSDLAGYLTDAGRIPEAIQILEPIAGDPSAGADTLNTLGIAYARAGQAAQARRTFERVLALNPTSSVPLENLGMLALDGGDLASARSYFARAVDAEPRSSRAHAGVGNVALRSGDRKAAVDAWTRAVQLDPANFDALYNLATTLARDGDLAAARPYIEQFVRTAPPVYDRDRRALAQLLRP